MAKLNEKNERTQKIIHLLITERCTRNCPLCCNKQYDMSTIEHVTPEELSHAEIICLTGGEPFLYANPNGLAWELKRQYPNIKYIYVYTNAYELADYLESGYSLNYLDGVNISIKEEYDVDAFNFIKDNKQLLSKSSNLLYVFNNLYPVNDIDGFKVTAREWQEDFIPADDSIFRRL